MDATVLRRDRDSLDEDGLRERIERVLLVRAAQVDVRFRGVRPHVERFDVVGNSGFPIVALVGQVSEIYERFVPFRSDLVRTLENGLRIVESPGFEIASAQVREARIDGRVDLQTRDEGLDRVGRVVHRQIREPEAVEGAERRRIHV